MAITLSGQNVYSLFGTGRVREIEVAFTSDGDGDATVNLSTLTGEAMVVGHLIGAKGIFGDPAPSADWDATVEDPDGIDLLAGGLVDCAADAGKLCILTTPVPIYHDLTVTIAGAGDTKKGTVKILISD